MRLAVVGDIHGHARELEETLNKLARHQVDRIVLLGDLIDRGPDPFACIDLARGWTFTARSGRTKRLDVVCGNHEDAYVRAFYGLPKPGKTEPVRPEERDLFDKLSDADIQWFASLPLTIEEPRLGVLCVHGGISPDMVRREHLDERVLRVRYLDALNQPVSGFAKTGTHWSDVYDGRFGVVLYGHESWQKPRVRRHSVGLDGEGWGAVHGAIFSNERSGLRMTQVYTTEYADRLRLFTKTAIGQTTWGW